MKLTIFAAAGGIGRQILEQAIDAATTSPRSSATPRNCPPSCPGKTYRTARGQNLRRGAFISRADVAHYLLRALDQPETIRQTIGLAN